MKTMSRWSGWLLRARNGYVLRDIAGEYLLIPVALQDGSESQIAILNEVGKSLWELLQEEQTVDTMVQGITDSYEVSDEEARADIIDFVNQLSENHLLLTKMEERK